VPISNVWNDDGHPRSNRSLNKAQSEPNADGTWTYVLANTDPGVHNWVDLWADRGHPHPAHGGVSGTNAPTKACPRRGKS
jgi:hypothetical protein